MRIAGDALIAGTYKEYDLLAQLFGMDTLTVVRVVIDLTAQYLVSNGIVDSLSIVDIGIGVAGSAAFATAGALPTPHSGSEYPDRGWIYVASLPVSQQADAVGVISTRARFQADIHSMRKVDKGKLFMNVLNTNITVGGAMQLTGRVRALALT